MKFKLTSEEKTTFMKMFRRAMKVVIFILLIRLIRIYMRANAQTFEGLREFYSYGNERNFINFIIPTIVICCILAMGCLLAFKGRSAFVHPIFLGLVLFVIVDVSFVLIYPELFLAVFDATFFHDSN